MAKVYNWGLAAARVKTWKVLREWYGRVIGDKGNVLFGNPCYMQLLMCVGLHLLDIPVKLMGNHTHSHANFPLTPEHSIRDRRLYYREELVFFAHNVPGVTH